MTRRQAAGLVVMSGAWGFVDGLFTGPAAAQGLLCLAAGLALFVAGADPARGARVRWFAGALAVLASQALLAWPMPWILAHAHDLPGAAALTAAALDALGVIAGSDAAGRLLMDTGSGPLTVAITGEMLALPLLLRFASAALVLGRVSPWRWGAAIALGAAARLVVMPAALACGARASILYEPVASLVSLLPMAAIRLDAGDGAALPWASGPARRLRGWGAAALLGLAAALSGAAGAWHPAGSPRPHGEVLIDESHSNWEWTGIPFDGRLYGQRSLYNYALWRSWIEAHHPTRVTRVPPGPADLAAAAVLIIKTPTTPYDDAMVERIERFVRGGGALWLIGDHTNLFGMSAILNRIAAPYGITFAYDDLFPLDHEGRDRFDAPSLAPHPMLRGIPVYPFETSCSLDVPWSAAHVMLGRRLASENVDYGHVNFFGDLRLQAAERFGVFTQAATLRHGRGRVAAFSDSTNFSNFSMLWPGRRALVANTLDWLRREPAPSGDRARVWGMGIAMAAAAAALVMGLPGGAARAVILWGCLGAHLAAAAGVSAWCGAAAGVVRPALPLRTIAFDTAVSRFSLTSDSPVMSRRAPTWDDFNAFFINAARTGWWPEVTRDLSGALARHDAVVVIRPRVPPGEPTRRRIAAFLERGGRLLIVDSAIDQASAAAQWLAPFGLGVERALQPLGGRPAPLVPSLQVPAMPGANRRVTPDGAVLAWRDVGQGRLVLMSDGALFSDRAVGGVYAVPEESHLSAHRSQADALALLLEPRGPEARP